MASSFPRKSRPMVWMGSVRNGRNRAALPHRVAFRSTWSGDRLDLFFMYISESRFLLRGAADSSFVPFDLVRGMEVRSFSNRGWGCLLVSVSLDRTDSFVLVVGEALRQSYGSR